MRGKPAVRRAILPDIRYNNVLISRFTHQVMRRGKKTVAQRVVYDALELVKSKSGKDPLAVFQEAMKNVSPTVEVKSRRIGGANYQIPVEVRGIRRETLALRWIIGAARSKHPGSMAERLATELMNAASRQGDAFKKKEDVRRMAEANRAFAHFA